MSQKLKEKIITLRMTEWERQALCVALNQIVAVLEADETESTAKFAALIRTIQAKRGLRS